MFSNTSIKLFNYVIILFYSIEYNYIYFFDFLDLLDLCFLLFFFLEPPVFFLCFPPLGPLVGATFAVEMELFVDELVSVDAVLVDESLAVDTVGELFEAVAVVELNILPKKFFK